MRRQDFHREVILASDELVTRGIALPITEDGVMEFKDEFKDFSPVELMAFIQRNEKHDA